MERKGKLITFDAGDRVDFGDDVVPNMSLDVSTATSVAIAMRTAADTQILLAEQTIRDALDSDSLAIIEANARMDRARRLRHCSSAIFQLAPEAVRR